MSETQRKNTELLLADRLSFVFGLLVIILGEYLILREPHLFTYFYTFLLTVLVAKRYQNILKLSLKCIAASNIFLQIS